MLVSSLLKKKGMGTRGERGEHCTKREKGAEEKELGSEGLYS